MAAGNEVGDKKIAETLYYKEDTFFCSDCYLSSVIPQQAGLGCMYMTRTPDPQTSECSCGPLGLRIQESALDKEILGFYLTQQHILGSGCCRSSRIRDPIQENSDPSRNRKSQW